MRQIALLTWTCISGLRSFIASRRAGIASTAGGVSSERHLTIRRRFAAGAVDNALVRAGTNVECGTSSSGRMSMAALPTYWVSSVRHFMTSGRTATELDFSKGRHVIALDFAPDVPSARI